LHSEQLKDDLAIGVAEKPEIIYHDFMETAKLGKRGQVSIPKAVLDQLGIEAETILLVEATDDGSIMLRPAGVYPIEIYSDARVAEFMEEDQISDDLRERIKKKLEES
jgi:AbrB family looped-hinge helix DNA binding protein